MYYCFHCCVNAPIDQTDGRVEVPVVSFHVTAGGLAWVSAIYVGSRRESLPD